MSATQAEPASFYPPLCCLSLPFSIRPEKAAVNNVSDSNTTFSSVSHRNQNATMKNIPRLFFLVIFLLFVCKVATVGCRGSDF